MRYARGKKRLFTAPCEIVYRLYSMRSLKALTECMQPDLKKPGVLTSLVQSDVLTPSVESEKKTADRL